MIISNKCLVDYGMEEWNEYLIEYNFHPRLPIYYLKMFNLLLIAFFLLN